MKITGASYGVLRAAAHEVGLGVRMWEGDACISVRLRTRPGGPYVATGGMARTLRAPCVHGFEAFIEALLERRPDATVETALTTYRGLDDFDARQDEIMVRVQTVYATETCECE